MAKSYYSEKKAAERSGGRFVVYDPLYFFLHGEGISLRLGLLAAAKSRK